MGIINRDIQMDQEGKKYYFKLQSIESFDVNTGNMHARYRRYETPESREKDIDNRLGKDILLFIKADEKMIDFFISKTYELSMKHKTFTGGKKW